MSGQCSGVPFRRRRSNAVFVKKWSYDQDRLEADKYVWQKYDTIFGKKYDTIFGKKYDTIFGKKYDTIFGKK
uniref:Uncharacterized protein n=1 Tax=Ciona savignyi TaxID=51511 RepID=H2YFD9_CIOSA